MTDEVPHAASTSARTRASGTLQKLAEVNSQMAALEKERVALQNQLLDEMGRAGVKTLSANLDDGRIAQATAVHATRLIFNEQQLRKKLGAPMWKKVTKQVLDRKLLEEQVALGEVSALDVADAAEEVPNKPYVKVTIK